MHLFRVLAVHLKVTQHVVDWRLILLRPACQRGGACGVYARAPTSTSQRDIDMNVFNRLRSGLFAVAAGCAGLLMLAGCSGGGDLGRPNSPTVATGCTGSDCSSLLIGLTDADGDFLS